MATVQNTITGKTKRSVGNITFSTWNGLYVMKSKPTKVRNPKTEMQQKSRSKFSAIMKIGTKWAHVLKTTFKNVRNKMTYLNSWLSEMSAALPNYDVFDYEKNNILIEQPSKFLVSKGTLPVVSSISIVTNPTDNNKIDINKPAENNVNPSFNNDICYVAIVNINTNEIALLNTNAKRSETLSTTVLNPFGSSQYFAYSFYMNDKGNVSNSIFVH